MTANEIREKYLKFFENRGHVRIDPSPLVLKDDPTTLFTSSGMQQLVPYLKGEKKHPEGKRLVDSQPSLRLQDIEEVGDNRHTTFFEMLGNWSLGDYFKAEQLPWVWEFFTKELGLPKEKLWVSVFEGTKEVPKDMESIEIWESLGVPRERIREYGVKKNWWSRAGTPEDMPAGEIGGPDSEVFFEFDVPHDPQYGPECHPNCECGRFLEIGNSVFMQYKKNEDGTLSELPQKNVDFGGGLERIAAAVNGNPDVFKIDLFGKIIETVEMKIFTNLKYSGPDTQRFFRILADHVKAATFLLSSGVVPSNKQQGYVLRRLLRKAIAQKYKLGEAGVVSNLIEPVVDLYKDVYPEVEKALGQKALVDEEERKFLAVLTGAQKEYKENFSPEDIFKMITTYGIPLEIVKDVFLWEGDYSEVEKLLQAHKELSRTSSSDMFKAK